MRKIIASILLLSLAICLFACKKPVEEPEQVEKPEQTLNYKYNPNNPRDERKGFFNYLNEKDSAKKLTVYLRNYASLNNFYKEYKPEDFPEIDCIKVEDLSGIYREQALNIINDPHFDTTNNFLVKSLDDFIISFNIYLADDSVEHLVEMGQILYNSYDYISEVCIYPLRSSWASAETTIIDSWSVDNISLPSALNLVQPSSDLKIGIIDTGIKADPNNGGVSLFNGKVDATLSRDFSGQGNPLDDWEWYGHGTMVSSVVLNMLGTNTNGLSPLVSLRVTESNGMESLTQQLINAINYAESKGIKIINYSGYISNDDGVSTTKLNNLKVAIENFSGLFICAAGNSDIDLDSGTKILYPASFNLDNVLVVGASTSSDNVWYDFTTGEASNYGSIVDIFAPGAYINVMQKTGYIGTYSGTSLASPCVAGVAGLILSANPNLTGAQLKSALCDCSDKIDALNDKCSTGGRLNAFKSVAYVYPHVHSANNSCHTVNGVHTFTCNFCENEIPTTYTYSKISVTSGHKATCKYCDYSKTEGHTWLKETNFFKCIYCRIITTNIEICHPGSVNTLLINKGISTMEVEDGFMLELTSDIMLLKYDGKYYLLAEVGKIDSLTVFVEQMGIA